MVGWFSTQTRSPARLVCRLIGRLVSRLGYGEIVYFRAFASTTLWRISLGSNSSREGVCYTKIDNLGLNNLGGLASIEKRRVDLVDQVICRITAGTLEYSGVHADSSDVIEHVHVGDLNIAVGGSTRDGVAVNAIGIHTCNRNLCSDC